MKFVHKFLSPLRYPGGKLKMAPFLLDLVRNQPKRPIVYAEPFAGGAGAALHMLAEGAVDRLALNDLNPGVAAFWRAVFFDTQRLVEAVRDTKPTIDTWHAQRAVYLDDGADAFARGFATFFLNRTNHSGILSARPIGGLEQAGTWKLDARYKVEDLTARIVHLGTYADRVAITSLDGADFITKLDASEDNAFLYVDPPYLVQGEELYLSAMGYDDHQTLARQLRRVASPWVLTYDRDRRVHEDLYRGLRCAHFTVSHTAASSHIGGEYMVVPDHVVVRSLEGFGPRVGTWLDTAELAVAGDRT